MHSPKSLVTDKAIANYQIGPVAAPHQGVPGQMPWQKFLRPGCRLAGKMVTIKL